MRGHDERARNVGESLMEYLADFLTLCVFFPRSQISRGAKFKSRTRLIRLEENRHSVPGER